MPYIQGNLALQTKKKQEQVQSYQETKRKVVRKRTIPTQEKLLYMFTVAVCVLVAGVIIFRYAQIYQMNLQIKQLTIQVQQLAEDNKVLQTKVEALSDPANIREQAVAQGMVPWDPNRKILVSSSDSPATAMKE